MRYVIPSFRLQDEDIDPTKRCFRHGRRVRCGADAPGVAELKKQGFEAVCSHRRWAARQSTPEKGEASTRWSF